MLEIGLLGHFRLLLDGHPVDGLGNPRLLVYLALHHGVACTRQSIAFALWPDSTDAQALTNLRRELHGLRRSLPLSDRILDVSRRTLTWRPDGPAQVDVRAFEEAVQRALSSGVDSAREAAALYGGDLLPDVYDDWMAPHRVRLKRAYQSILSRLAALLEDRREYAAAASTVRTLIEQDPLDETWYRALMRLSALSGDRVAAVRAFQACVAALRDELDVEPSFETTELHERLRSAEVSGTRAPLPEHDILPLVGREPAWVTLQAAWKLACSGVPTLGVVSGEAGIGKTRLLEELSGWAKTQGFEASYARSYAAEGALAYGPIVSWLRSPAVAPSVTRLEAPWVAELARLLPELALQTPARDDAAHAIEPWQRQRLFDATSRALRPDRGPRLLVLDDVQWADRDSLELIHVLLREEAAAPLLIVLAARPEEAGDNTALSALVADVSRHGHVREVELRGLTSDETATVAMAVSGRTLSAEERQAVFDETAGNPLHVVELARMGIASVGARRVRVPADQLHRRAGAGSLPPRIRAVVAARLERLPPDAAHLMATAAAIGRDFTIELLARATELDARRVPAALEELLERRVVREVGPSRFDFVHDHVRDVAYEAIGPVRRPLLHRHVAGALEVINGDDLDAVSAELAAHFLAAGEVGRSITHLERAAVVAARVFASRDAAHHLSQALDLLRTTPATPGRDEHELRLLLLLSPAVLGTEGYATARQEEIFERARLVAARTRRERDLILALNGLWAVYVVAGRNRSAVTLARKLVQLKDRPPDLRASCEIALAGTLTLWGDFRGASDQFDRALRAYEPRVSRWMPSGTDAAVITLAWGAHAKWIRGETSLAREWAAEAIEHANRLQNPYSLTVANAYAAIVAQLDGDDAATLARIAVVESLCAHYRFAYYAEWVTILQGWLERHADPDSASRIGHALDNLCAIRALIRTTYYTTLLAEVHLAAGRLDAARSALSSARAAALRQGERWWLAEIHRVRGGLVRGPAGERQLRRALAIARSQGAHSLALRAVTDLARRCRREMPLLAQVLDQVPDPSPHDRRGAEEVLGSAVPT